MSSILSLVTGFERFDRLEKSAVGGHHQGVSELADPSAVG
jgi:hypothetical protein